MFAPRVVSFAAALALVLLLASAAAHADVAPPNACNNAGQSCNTARGPSGDFTAPGTCVATTCSHTGPQPDGSIGTTQVACNVCEVNDAGTTDSSAGTLGGDGCGIGRLSPLEVAPIGLIVAGAALLAWSRRRPTRS